MKGISRHFSNEGKLGECHQETYHKGMGKGSFLSKKKTLKESWNIKREERTMERAKIGVNTIDFLLLSFLNCV